MSIDLNFETTPRTYEYPTISQVREGTNEQIIEWINTLAKPITNDQALVFNEVFNQFHLRGGK